jgi:hypothetical protein
VGNFAYFPNRSENYAGFCKQTKLNKQWISGGPSSKEITNQKQFPQNVSYKPISLI